MIDWPSVQPRLTEGELLLRPVESTDTDSIFDYCSDFSSAEYTTIPWPYTREHAVAAVDRWAASFVDRTALTYAITEDGGEMLGSVSLHSIVEFDHVAEIGYLLAPAARGRGLAVRSVRLLTDYAFAIGFRRLQGLVAEKNLASATVLERCGYTRETLMRKAMTNRDNSQCDALLYARVVD